MKSANILAVLIGLLSTSAASAENLSQPNSFFRVGASRIKLADEGKVFIDGVLNPGAGYSTPERYVASAEIGHFISREIAVSFSATTPATTQNIPAGSLAGLPNLGNDSFSIFSLAGTFHPLRGRVVSPYLGWGVALQKTWSTEDRLATNLQVNDAFGPMVQGGLEFDLSRRLGVFADVKKAFYTANASGDLGPSHITAKAKLDPFILQVGGIIRF